LDVFVLVWAVVFGNGRASANCAASSEFGMEIHHLGYSGEMAGRQKALFSATPGRARGM
jgi:hypothetical protein